MARKAIGASMVAMLVVLAGVSVQAQEVEVVNGDIITHGDPNGLLDDTAYVSPSGGLSTDPIRSNINSLNVQNFPYIFGSATVDTLGVGHGGLTQANFEIYEDGILQTDFFQVVPPDSSSSGIRVADIVFAMDNSGSMSPYQAAIRANIDAFVDSLTLSVSDVSLGLVRFGQSGNNPVFEDGGALTTDLTYFRDDVWARNVDSGITEPGWEAMRFGAVNASWRPGSQRILIWIGDETPSQGTTDEATARQTLVSSGVKLFAFASTSEHAQFLDIISATHGGLFDVTQDFSVVLDSIATAINSTYSFRYKTSNTAFDGVERQVVLVAELNGNEGRDTTAFTPDHINIERTAATLALHQQGQLLGDALTIEADISDFVAPHIQAATLYYRTTGATTYSSVAMTNTSGSTYAGTIPGSAAQNPGVDYYITATDGEKTGSDPSVDASSSPYQIAVLPNEPPVITHTTPGPVGPGVPVVISADVVDITNQVTGVSLHYRTVGTLAYQQVMMAGTGGDTYEATIPGAVVLVPGVEYYLRAVDDYGVTSFAGSSNQPLLVEVAVSTGLRLEPGFNLVSLGEAAQGDSMASLMAPIAGNLIRVLGFETAAYNPNPPGTGGKLYDPNEPAFVNTLHLADRHLGYWIKMAAADTLQIGGVAAKPVMALGAATGEDPLHPVFDFMAIHGELSINGEAAPVGTIVEITDGSGTLAGRGEVQHRGYYGFVPIYRDDEASAVDEGADAGEWLNVVVDGQVVPERVQWTSFGDVVRKDIRVEVTSQSTPADFALESNYPNPFNPTTTITYRLAADGEVALSVWNLSGQRTRELVSGYQMAGRHEIVWDGRDALGHAVGNGVYLCDLRSGDRRSTRKMVLVK